MKVIPLEHSKWSVFKEKKKHEIKIRKYGSAPGKKKKKSKETDSPPEESQMLDLLCKNFKSAILNMF